jgi:hypothetical protein
MLVPALIGDIAGVCVLFQNFLILLSTPLADHIVGNSDNARGKRREDKRLAKLFETFVDLRGQFS